ncbi:hypothetical protein SRHO_G00056830 [Serrasalmus rhombeus]
MILQQRRPDNIENYSRERTAAPQREKRCSELCGHWSVHHRTRRHRKRHWDDGGI